MSKFIFYIGVLGYRLFGGDWILFTLKSHYEKKILKDINLLNDKLTECRSYRSKLEHLITLTDHRRIEANAIVSTLNTNDVQLCDMISKFHIQLNKLNIIFNSII